MLIAISIFIFTLTLVIWQPKGLGIGYSAAFGALLALFFGVIDLSDVGTVWGIIWNAVLTFVAIIIISLVLDETGFFRWAALYITRFGQGSGTRLFFYMILLGAIISAFFANDGTALILTPIVMAILLQLGASRATTLAFVMGAGFIADTASLPLTVSNLVNIVSADYFSISFSRYASVMIPVNVISVFATLLVLFLFFRKDIPFQYQLMAMTEVVTPKLAIQDRPVFYLGWGVLASLLIGFFISDIVGIPVSFIAMAGALILLIASANSSNISATRILKAAPWQIVIFALGMYLVVFGLRNAGIMEYLVFILNDLSQQNLWISTTGTGFVMAVLSSTMNNLPTVLMGVLSIEASSATGVIQEGMIYANVIGSDLGPKFTPIGSLATLLWLHVLASKNLKITWGYYFRVGVLLTTPVLLVTLSALVLRLSI